MTLQEVIETTGTCRFWNHYAGRIKQAAPPDPVRARLLENADHVAHHLDDVPVLLVVCARLADVLPTDQGLGRLARLTERPGERSMPAA
jgi:hypothetical protein